MFCTACGMSLRDTDRFCPGCGKSAVPESATFSSGGGTMPGRRLVRTMRDKKIAGVCGGLALYFGVDSTIVRFILLGLFLLYGVGFLVYVGGWIVMPRDIDVAPVSA